MSNVSLADAQALIHKIPDYPDPGVIFQDIMPVLADPAAFQVVVRELIRPFTGQFEVVAGIEARGFLLAGAASMVAGVGMLPIRKAGKLPRPAVEASYSLEYGTARIEAQADIPRGSRVLIIDDVLATGGTLGASERLIAELGCEAIGHSVVLEIAALGGRSKLSKPVHCVFPNDDSGY